MYATRADHQPVNPCIGKHVWATDRVVRRRSRRGAVRAVTAVTAGRWGSGLRRRRVRVAVR